LGVLNLVQTSHFSPPAACGGREKWEVRVGLVLQELTAEV
jgi:hypothetical protein